MPNTFVVSSCDDSGPGTLRTTALAASDGDTIDLTQLTCSTISLTTGAILFVQDSLTLLGPGRDRLTVDGTGSSGGSLLYHTGTGQLTIKDMTLSHGDKYRTDTASIGGCVHSAGDVNIFNSDILDCTARSVLNNSALGGAVYAHGRAYLSHSTVSGSHAIAHGGGYASGGGIYGQGSVVTLYTTVTDNDARSYSGTPTFGGGVFTHGTALIRNSAIVRNHAKRMGGLAAADRSGYTSEILDSTIAGNSADYIGGVYSRSPMFLYNSTIADNTATHASATGYSVMGVGMHMGPGTTLSSYSSLIANNTSFEAGGYDLAGADNNVVVAGSNNLVVLSDLTLPSDTLRGPVALGSAPADNGGLTPTVALLAGSQGVNAGLLPSQINLDFDQRGPGFERTSGGAPDIGAFEVQTDRLFTNGFNFGPIAAEGPPTFPPLESFDELASVVPALPAGWTNNHSGFGRGWSTVLSNAFSQPIAAFVNDEANVSDSSLETPSFDVEVANGRLTFTHSFNLEVAAQSDTIGFDGVVLEISIAGGPFVDIIDAGGSFVQGGYDHTIFGQAQNPLANRQAWSGDSQGYRTVSVDLPAAANGHSVRLRWRLGTDYVTGVLGYSLDSVSVDVRPAR